MSDVSIPESRFQELLGKELHLEGLLRANPELESSMKLTSTARKYRKAFSTFVQRVDEVLSHEELKGIFQIAAVHGFDYKGPSLAQDIVDAKKLLGLK
jgi:hypothetical protein